MCGSRLRLICPTIAGRITQTIFSTQDFFHHLDPGVPDGDRAVSVVCACVIWLMSKHVAVRKPTFTVVSVFSVVTGLTVVRIAHLQVPLQDGNNP